MAYIIIVIIIIITIITIIIIIINIFIAQIPYEYDQMRVTSMIQIKYSRFLDSRFLYAGLYCIQTDRWTSLLPGILITNSLAD